MFTLCVVFAAFIVEGRRGVRDVRFGLCLLHDVAIGASAYLHIILKAV